MLDDAARQILSQPVIVRISTITPDGYPHSVPVWFMLDGDALIVFTERGSQKAHNARANARGSIAIGGDPVGSPCYLVEGDIRLEDDPDHAVTAQITYHYEGKERGDEWLAMWKGSDHVILRLTPRRVVRIS